MYLNLAILFYFFLSTNGQTWSSWFTCDSIPNCFRRRVLTCDDGEGIQCAKDVYEQRAVSLSVNGCNGACIVNESLRKPTFAKNPLQSCQGNCYDATEIFSYNCQGHSQCQLLDYHRCYVEQTCTGVWSPMETFTQCSATCGGGTQTAVAVCKNITTSQISYNCKGSDYGQIRRSKIKQTCNTQQCSEVQSTWTKSILRRLISQQKIWQESSSFTHKSNAEAKERVRRQEECIPDPCNMWSSWAPATNCNVSCGGGRYTIFRSCLCSDAIGFTPSQTENSQCNTPSCPSWSSWSESSPCSVTCGGGTREQSSTCTYNGSPVALCNDTSSSIRTRQEDCNTPSCPTWSSWSESSPCSVPCGGGTQEQSSTCTYNGSPSTLCDGSSGLSTKTRTEACIINLCTLIPVFGEWTQWTSCNSCNELRSRSRNFTSGGSSRRDVITESCSITPTCSVSFSSLVNHPYFPLSIVIICILLIIVIILGYRLRKKSSTNNKHHTELIDMNKPNQQEPIGNINKDTQQHPSMPVHFYEKVNPQKSADAGNSTFSNGNEAYLHMNNVTSLNKSDDNPYIVPDDHNPYIVPDDPNPYIAPDKPNPYIVPDVLGAPNLVSHPTSSAKNTKPDDSQYETFGGKK